MAKTFFVQKKSGTYSDILEAYGLGNLLNKILNSVNSPRAKVIIKDNGGYYELERKSDKSIGDIFRSPRQAYAYLIDKVNGKGTWDNNPWVVVYYFKLIK